MNILLEGDVLDRLLEMASNSVDCICTSPPYWGLRNYGIPPTKWPAISYSILGMPIDIPEMECCLGDETTPHQFIGHRSGYIRWKRNYQAGSPKASPECDRYRTQPGV